MAPDRCAICKLSTLLPSGKEQLGVLICDYCGGEVHAECTDFEETPSPMSEFGCPKCLAAGKYTGGAFDWNSEEECYIGGNPDYKYKVLLLRSDTAAAAAKAPRGSVL